MSGYSFKNIVCFCLMILFTLTNSENPDEMPHNAAFHPNLYCLLKCPFRGSSVYRVRSLKSDFMTKIVS